MFSGTAYLLITRILSLWSAPRWLFLCPLSPLVYCCIIPGICVLCTTKYELVFSYVLRTYYKCIMCRSVRTHLLMHTSYKYVRIYWCMCVLVPGNICVNIVLRSIYQNDSRCCVLYSYIWCIGCTGMYYVLACMYVCTTVYYHSLSSPTVQGGETHMTKLVGAIYPNIKHPNLNLSSVHKYLPARRCSYQQVYGNGYQRYNIIYT